MMLSLDEHGVTYKPNEIRVRVYSGTIKLWNLLAIIINIRITRRISANEKPNRWLSRLGGYSAEKATTGRFGGNSSRSEET